MLDNATKRRILQFAQEIGEVRHAKEDAVAAQEFERAAHLRDREDLLRMQLARLNLSDLVDMNCKRLVDAQGRKPFFPVLDMFCSQSGEVDTQILAMLPTPLVPPIRCVVGAIPSCAISTLTVALALEDIESHYFRARIPCIMPDSIAANEETRKQMVRAIFMEIGRALGAFTPVVLCVLRPTVLPQDVQEEVFSGVQRTNCDFVMFETGEKARLLLERLPSGTRLLEA
jgi:hypothetical protein